MRVAERSAMQVEAGVDLDLAARKPLLEPTVDRYQRRWRLDGHPRRCGMRAQRRRLRLRVRLGMRAGMRFGRRTCALRLIAVHAPPLERHDRSRNSPPKRLILVGQPTRLVVSAHVPDFDLPACRGDFAFFASPDLLDLALSDLPLPALPLSGRSDLPSLLPSFLAATSVGIAGFARGSGILRPASSISSERGISITKRPW